MDILVLPFASHFTPALNHATTHLSGKAQTTTGVHMEPDFAVKAAQSMQTLQLAIFMVGSWMFFLFILLPYLAWKYRAEIKERLAATCSALSNSCGDISDEELRRISARADEYGA